MATATLGGGCFWCLEAVFDRLKGVASVESGYMGGRADQATYRQVCDGDTGHVEVVRVTFDPDLINYRELLEVFFALHDPTTLNRQGKRKRTRTGYGTRKDTKRAIVTLAPGSKPIDLFGAPA